MVIGAIMLFTQPADAMTIQEVIDTLGDVAALEQMCPMLTPVHDKSVMVSFFGKSDVKWELFDAAGPYNADIEVAQKKFFSRRLHGSVKRNCLDALELYGPDGTVHKGFFKGTLSKIDPLNDLPIPTLMDTMGDIIALERICPDLQADNTAMQKYINSTGVPFLSEKVRQRIGDDISPAKRKAFSRRKAASSQENCSDGLGLYGPSGTVIPGVFTSRKAND